MTSKTAAQPMQALSRDVPIAWLLVGLVFVLGNRIPLPGFEPAAFAFSFETTSGVPRWSILLLGLEPILSALLVFELLKLLSPRFLRWSSKARAGFVGPRTLIAALALSIAAHRAMQYHDAFVFTGALSTDGLSGPLVVATLVAGVATLLFLSERVEMPGLALGGFWLLVSVSWTESLALWSVDLVEQFRIGAIDDRALAFVVGLTGLAVTSTVFSARALRGHVETSGGDPLRWSALLVWPPVLAHSLSNAVAGWAEGLLPDRPTAIPSLFSAVWVVSVCIVLPVVVFLYARSIIDISPRGAVWRGRRKILALLALVQVAICCGFQLLSERMVAEFMSTVPIQGTTLIVVVVVASAAVRTDRGASADRTRRAERR